MELTWEQTRDIANYLDDVIADNFHNAIWRVLKERDDAVDFELSDEDVLRIKEQLKRIL